MGGFYLKSLIVLFIEVDRNDYALVSRVFGIDNVTQKNTTIQVMFMVMTIL